MPVPAAPYRRVGAGEKATVLVCRGSTNRTESPPTSGAGSGWLACPALTSLIGAPSAARLHQQAGHRFLRAGHHLDRLGHHRPLQTSDAPHLHAGVGAGVARVPCREEELGSGSAGAVRDWARGLTGHLHQAAAESPRVVHVEPLRGSRLDVPRRRGQGGGVAIDADAQLWGQGCRWGRAPPWVWSSCPVSWSVTCCSLSLPALRRADPMARYAPRTAVQAGREARVTGRAAAQ